MCDELEVEGCRTTACNYDMSATDAGSCDYADEGFDCDGNFVIGEDCNGVCGGSAVIDECGVCGGSGIPKANVTATETCLTLRGLWWRQLIVHGRMRRGEWPGPV